MWSPEGNPVLREYAMENDSPRSKCCSCSAGHSPVSSPIALRCRPTRLSNLLNKNGVLDRYIDRGNEDAIVNEKLKQCSPVTSVVSNLGRPPRPQSTVPSIPKLVKETTERYLDVDLKDACLWELAQEGTGDNHKITATCNAFRRPTSMSDASERESATSVEDIYEDLQDVRIPNIICPSSCPTSGMTSGCPIIMCSCFCDASQIFMVMTCSFFFLHQRSKKPMTGCFKELKKLSQGLLFLVETNMNSACSGISH